MSNKVFNILETEIIHNIFDQYQIQLNYHLDIINIKIQNNYNIYESNFNLEYLNILLCTNFSIYKMIVFINQLITKKNIKIEKNKNNIKLILIVNNNHLHLILNEKNLISNEIIKQLINEIKEIQIQNKTMTNKIELIENKNKELNKKIELIENKNKELKNKIQILEEFHFLKGKQKIKLTKTNLKNINSIEPHKGWINSLSTFPSGNIISVSGDKSIKIYDINFNELQIIQNAHDQGILYVEVKDENNFITCSGDKSIKLWIKKEKKYQINKIINNAHDDYINKVIYCSNGNLISCSDDKKIKIWKENNNNNYDNIQIFTHSDHINSILLLEDKNILISSGLDGTKFWDLCEINNNNYIIYFDKTICGWNRGLCRLDEDRIIAKGNGINTLKIISILNLEIIKEINSSFTSSAIFVIEDKGIFLVGGFGKDIEIYRNDNYECIQKIQNAHNDNIRGFIELQDGSIVSFSKDKTIKIWYFLKI